MLLSNTPSNTYFLSNIHLPSCKGILSHKHILSQTHFLYNDHYHPFSCKSPKKFYHLRAMSYFKHTYYSKKLYYPIIIYLLFCMNIPRFFTILSQYYISNPLSSQIHILSKNHLPSLAV